MDNILFVLGQILILISSLLVWWLANNKIIDHSLQEKWTYFVIGEIFFNLIFNFAEFEGFDILRGQTTIDLLKPQPYLLLKIFDTYGESLLQNIIKSGILAFMLIIMLLTNNITYFNWINFFQAVCLLPIAWIILYLIEITVAFSAFFMRQMNGVILNFSFFSNLFMGRTFPLNLIIFSQTVLLFNPFAYLFYHPVQIYLGKYSNLEIFYVFLGGIAWCFILYFLAKLVFQIGLKRNESVGL
jgi:ABC-2 type transport system permease protein